MTAEDTHFLNRLVAQGILQGDLVKAKNSQLEHSIREKGMTRGLIEQFGLSENVVADAICKEFGFGKMLIVNEIETAPTQLLTEDEILTYRAVPIFCIGLELTMAFTDPPGKQLRLHLQKMSGFQILPVITTVSDFEAALKKYRGALDRVQRIGSTVDLQKYDIRKSPAVGRTAVSENEADATIAQLVDELLLRAAKTGASDIHIEPAEDELMIRFRIDGVLQRILSLPTAYQKGVVSVIKAKSGMDMFERSLPQDGRMTLNAADRVFDVRINSLPMLLGEKIVLRLLGKTAMMTNLDNLGFSQRNLDMFRTLMRLPNGIILVTGPTGSGKTTTLYSALNEMRDIGKNITTVENPVEYKLPLINQVQVNADRGLTFASVLRAILRQDPNVILVGEIRDAETGIIATEAALTGHLVLSTLHTNDAIGAISRLVNLGVASFWVSASVIGVLAQRLVRKICERCKEEYQPDTAVLQSFGLSNLPQGITLFKGRGCSFCNGTGYKGRMAIHEILILTEEMRDVIYGEVTTTKLRNLAMANNFQDMYFDGLRKALAGVTSLDEVQRVARRAI